MAELLAQGPKPEDRWQRHLPQEQDFVLGRQGEAWSVPWDPWISREHIRLRWDGTSLQVCKLQATSNPIFFHGQEVESCQVRSGDGFVLGQTYFTVLSARVPAASDPDILIQARTISAQELKQIPFRDAPHRLDVLSRLPDVITHAANDADLLLHLGNMLLAGIPRADAVAIVSLDSDQPRVLHQERRRSTTAEMRPSRRLIHEAHATQQSMLYVFPAAPALREDQFTVTGDFDWAFCTPIRSEACAGWGIYVTGCFTGDPSSTILGPWETNELGDDLKFTELVAAILGSLRQVQHLQQRQTILSGFFSPGVLHVLLQGDPEANLRPRPVEATVLFCDLRGFSGTVEKAAADLLAVLHRVSEALGVMTQNILVQDGVIADFQGDSAMAFWGWPLANPHMVQQACTAALLIRTTFEAFAGRPEHPLAGFQVGIGIATGNAVAGSIGPRDQSKVSVFGPVVNLASRLQDMTKLFRVPILMDERTAQVLKETTPWEVARSRCLARVKPYGLTTPMMVHELLPPAADFASLTDDDIRSYDAALEAFLAKDWSTAYRLLYRVSLEDRGKELITSYILQNDKTPPPGWNGIIDLPKK